MSNEITPTGWSFVDNYDGTQADFMRIINADIRSEFNNCSAIKPRIVSAEESSLRLLKITYTKKEIKVGQTVTKYSCSESHFYYKLDDFKSDEELLSYFTEFEEFAKACAKYSRKYVYRADFYGTSPHSKNLPTNYCKFARKFLNEFKTFIRNSKCISRATQDFVKSIDDVQILIDTFNPIQYLQKLKTAVLCEDEFEKEMKKYDHEVFEYDTPEYKNQHKIMKNIRNLIDKKYKFEKSIVTLNDIDGHIKGLIPERLSGILNCICMQLHNAAKKSTLDKKTILSIIKNAHGIRSYDLGITAFCMEEVYSDVFDEKARVGYCQDIYCKRDCQNKHEDDDYDY